MKVTHVFTGKDNESHFEEMDIPFEKARYGTRTKSMKTKEIMFNEIDDSFVIDWHPAPCRQFVITLQGEGEIEIGDGTKRRFGPGDVAFIEDTTGHGHISRVTSKVPRQTAFIPLE